MSLEAGGVELNLTAASNVFLMVIIPLTTLTACRETFLLSDFYFLANIRSMVESCSRGASNHEDSPKRAEKAGPSEAVHC